ncbi:hypothetical protein EDD11_006994 [Mortierella claussenii]|nr:hypothetical protein EDD11_006994 [Mortierella claussenii]
MKALSIDSIKSNVRRTLETAPGAGVSSSTSSGASPSSVANLVADTKAITDCRWSCIQIIQMVQKHICKTVALDIVTLIDPQLYKTGTARRAEPD